MNAIVLLACLASMIQPGPGAPTPPAQPAAVAPAETPFQMRLKDIDERLGRVTQLRAEFEQRKSTALLKKPIVSSGGVLVKGDRVRWDTRRPRPSTLVSSGGEMRIYYPEAAVVEVHRPPKEMLELSGTPLPRLGVLSRRFDLKEIDAALMGAAPGDTRFVAVELMPKDDDLKQHVASVRVLLDADVPCVKRLRLEDPDGETTEIEFKDVRSNAEVRDEELELKVPDGTRVVQQGEPGGRPGSKGKEAGKDDAAKPGTTQK